jgi:hypothetical protein
VLQLGWVGVVAPKVQTQKVGDEFSPSSLRSHLQDDLTSCLFNSVKVL